MAKTYLESIAHFDEAGREYLIAYAPTHTRIPETPEELRWLRGSVVDLGFKHLGLNLEGLNAVLRAFAHMGVAIPHSRWKLRYTGVAMATVVEPSTGDEEVTLPEHWKQAVWVMDKFGRPTWMGRRVAKFDRSKYQKTPDGWELLEQ
jgi:hypothetical protein